MSHAPYVPAWMDDAGLTPIQFRVLAHLHRRAGNKMCCWPGADSIRINCRISDDALWPAIKALEDRGFVRRKKRRYNANEYFMLLPAVTLPNRVTVSPVETGELLPDLSGEQSPPITGELLPGNWGCKGTKEKGTKRKVVGQNGCTAGAAPAPLNDSDWIAGLNSSAAYAGINVANEFEKMRMWCAANKKQPTRRRFVNWLNRCEKPLSVGKTSTRSQEEKAHDYKW